MDNSAVKSTDLKELPKQTLLLDVSHMLLCDKMALKRNN